MSVYRAAVCGLGRKGWSYDTDDGYMPGQRPHSHVGAYLACPRTKLVAVCDRDDNVLAKWRAAHLDVPAYNDIQVMMEKEKPQIVSVVTQVGDHMGPARLIPRYDSVKLIFVEKPLAPTSQEAERIVQTCEYFHCKLAVNHTRRWDPLWINARIKAQALGPTRRVVGCCSGDKFEAGIHMADLFRMFHDPEGVYVDLKGEKPYSPYLVFDLDVFCEQGRIRVLDNGFLYETYRRRTSPDLDGFNVLTAEGGQTRSPNWMSPMIYAVMNLVDACDGNGAEIACTGQDGVAALRTYESWKK